MIATDAVDRDELLRQLEAADTKFHRAAAPIVDDECERFVATGRYPYNDSIVTEIATKYRVAEDVWAPGQQFHHQAAHDLARSTGNDLIVKLHHEVYLASQQRHARELMATEEKLAAEGFVPITSLEPAVGMRVRFPDGVVYRLVRCDGWVWDDDNRGEWTGAGDWALLAPRKRSNGISLNGLVRQQRAYEKAKEQGYVEMDNPAVRMYAPA